MSNQNGMTTMGNDDVNPVDAPAANKGKGKAVDSSSHEMSVDEEEDSSDEETGAEEETAEPAVEEDEEDMAEIEENNIIADGRRTRGKTIDFAKAAETAGDELEDDEDDDDDFEEEDDEDAMQE
ncbi:MAG: Histone H2A.Z-specific chaperone [Pycnora praestabilis]|nr:MAG: Histone H2A.Z-specific chaperone [Pycnora praestabilis]